jgi:membrane peptidoglycan carboxypeptidase
MFRRDDQTHQDKAGKVLNNPFLKMYGTGGAEKVHGNSFPARIWKDYMSTATASDPMTPFQKPTSTVGEVFYGNVPSPTPTPTATTPTMTTPPTTAPTTPPTSPSWTPSTNPTPSDTPTKPCFPWDQTCNTPTPTDTATTPGGGQPTKTRGPGGGTGG